MPFYKEPTKVTLEQLQNFIQTSKASSSTSESFQPKAEDSAINFEAIEIQIKTDQMEQLIECLKAEASPVRLLKLQVKGSPQERMDAYPLFAAFLTDDEKIQTLLLVNSYASKNIEYGNEILIANCLVKNKTLEILDIEFDRKTKVIPKENPTTSFDRTQTVADDLKPLEHLQDIQQIISSSEQLLFFHINAHYSNDLLGIIKNLFEPKKERIKNHLVKFQQDLTLDKAPLIQFLFYKTNHICDYKGEFYNLAATLSKAIDKLLEAEKCQHYYCELSKAHDVDKQINLIYDVLKLLEKKNPNSSTASNDAFYQLKTRFEKDKQLKQTDQKYLERKLVATSEDLISYAISIWQEHVTTMSTACHELGKYYEFYPGLAATDEDKAWIASNKEDWIENQCMAAVLYLQGGIALEPELQRICQKLVNLQATAELSSNNAKLFNWGELEQQLRKAIKFCRNKSEKIYPLYGLALVKLVELINSQKEKMTSDMAKERFVNFFELSVLIKSLEQLPLAEEILPVLKKYFSNEWKSFEDLWGSHAQEKSWGSFNPSEQEIKEVQKVNSIEVSLEKCNLLDIDTLQYYSNKKLLLLLRCEKEAKMAIDDKSRAQQLIIGLSGFCEASCLNQDIPFLVEIVESVLRKLKSLIENTPNLQASVQLEQSALMTKHVSSNSIKSIMNLSSIEKMDNEKNADYLRRILKVLKKSFNPVSVKATSADQLLASMQQSGLFNSVVLASESTQQPSESSNRVDHIPQNT